MTTPNLTPAPAAPQRSDPSTFASRADAFLTWWVDVIAELNAFVIWVQSIADSITSSSNYWSAANVVNAADINCSLGVYFTKTVNGVITFTFSNPPASGKAYSFTLCVTHTSGSITWPASVKWVEGLLPSLTTGKKHQFIFTTNDGGVTWLGAGLANFG